MSRTVADLVRAMDAIAPPRLAESWDNVGLLLGDPARALDGPALLTIDLTPEVAREAIESGAGAVVSYHPPIFKPITRLDGSTDRSRALLELVRAGIAVHAPHTALDAAPGGLADWLADVGAGPGAAERRALEAPSPGGASFKVVVFTPADRADAVRDAMSAAGAGVIGGYTRCSFSSPGEGTFFGSEGTDPAVGERGRLERAPELRLEMVCPAGSLGEAVDAARAAHPYEEPAIDVVPLAPAPETRLGPGRAVTLARPEPAESIARRVAAALGVERVKLASPEGAPPVARLGACPGAGASLAGDAIDDGATLYLTGEMSHHEVLAALERGCAVVLAGHTNTERGYLPTLAERLASGDPAIEARVSARDAWPLRFVGP